MQGDRRGDERADALTGGSDKPPLSQRVPRHWHARVVVVAAFIVGLVIGGYGGYAWLGSLVGSEEATIRVTARVGGPRALHLPYPPYRLPVELHNAGHGAVTVRQAHLRVAGYNVVLAPNLPRVVDPGETETFLYGIQPDCGHSPPEGSATVRLRMRTSSGDVRAVTVNAPVAQLEFRSGHAILCSEPPPQLTVEAETLAVRHVAGGDLAVRLKLAAPSNGGHVRERLRLLRINMSVPGIDMVGVEELSGRNVSTMPATVTPELAIVDCTSARDSVGDPQPVLLALTSTEGPYLVYAHVDAEFSDALRDYVSDHCASRE